MYISEDGKIKAIIEEIKECVKTGQPALIGTINIDKSELLSTALKREGIKHQVLNAKNNEKESEIVAQAGRKGAITIATNMAGRGTDILLGGNPEFMAKKEMVDKGYTDEEISYATAFNYVDDEKLNQAREEYNKLYNKHKEVTDKEKEEVIALGGLHIIGTERHESRRIDNQLRGRSGRQGDPGSSVFFLSLDDDLFKRFATDKLRKLLAFFKIDDSTPLQFKQLSKQIETSQRKVELQNFSIRKTVLQFDDVMNKQREIIYSERNKVLDGEPVHDQILKMFPDVVSTSVHKIISDDIPYYNWDLEALNKELENGLLERESNTITEEFVEGCDVNDVIEKVLDIIYKRYDERHSEVAELGIDFEDIEREVLLRMVDINWMSQIENMQIMKDEILSRQFGQQDPIMAYKKEGFDMFDAMIDKIKETTCKVLLNARIRRQPPEPAPEPVKILFTGKELTPEERAAQKQKQKLQVQKTIYNDKPKAGRNDPCPCGSGRKYKNCCWDKDHQ